MDPDEVPPTDEALERMYSPGVRAFRMLGPALILAVLLLKVVAIAASFDHPRSDPPEQFSPSVVRIGSEGAGYSLFIPSDLPNGAPLLLVFPGYDYIYPKNLGREEELMRMPDMTGYEFEILAERNKFLIAYLDGVENRFNDCRRDEPARDEVGAANHVAATHALIATLRDERHIDPKHVFAVGYSTGGQMAYRLALEMPGEVAGVAVVAANLPTPQNNLCHDEHAPVPMMIIDGTDDPISPFNGGKISFHGIGNRGEVMSSPATAEFFVHRNGQAAAPAIEKLASDGSALDSTSVERQTWRSPNHADVVFEVVHGGGHIFPNRRTTHQPTIFGFPTHVIDAPKEIWEFFARQM